MRQEERGLKKTEELKEIFQCGFNQVDGGAIYRDGENQESSVLEASVKYVYSIERIT